MYAYIKGNVDYTGVDRAVIEAVGVGYELICSKRTLDTLRVGSEAKLYTHFHLAQDVAALYGFASEDERAMFRKLITVSRIGPKVAISVLSAMSAEDVAFAVLTDNAAAFDGVPGMGRKTAARVILELKGKVDGGMPAAAADGTASASVSPEMRSEVIAALVSLGYDGASAGRVVSSLPECERTEDMLRLALREIAKKL